MNASVEGSRLQVPLTVHDALRRGRALEAVKHLRGANPGLDLRSARDAVRRLGRGDPANRLEDGAQPGPGSGALPEQTDTLPSEVAAKLATGNILDAARRLCEKQPGLSQDEALETVERHASPLLQQQARTETVARGDSGRMGWLFWMLVLVVGGGALALWWGQGG